MNPLVIFDYIYYRIASFYDRIGFPEYSDFSGVAILSIIQFCNISDIAYLFNFRNILINVFHGYDFIVLLILLILNYIRYIRLIENLYDLEDKWDNENKIKRRFKGILIIIYFLLSIYFIAPNRIHIR